MQAAALCRSVGWLVEAMAGGLGFCKGKMREGELRPRYVSGT